MSLVSDSSTGAEISAPGIHTVHAPDREPRVVDIYPRKGWQAVRWLDLWEFRDLMWVMALRDVTVRYKQTVLGASWAILQPLLQSVVMTIFFGWLLGVSARIEPLPDGRLIPYLVFALSGQVLWGCFSSALNSSAGSIVGNANMIRKVYFPRLLMPISAMGAPTVDCFIGIGLLFAVMGYYVIWPGPYGVAFSPRLLLAPLFVLSTLLTALGVGILLSALTVAYRDFKYVVPFVIQIWYFITPVIYPATIIPERYRWVLFLNPMAGTIEGFRGIVLGRPIDFAGWAQSMEVTLLALIVGTVYFTRVEQSFADIA